MKVALVHDFLLYLGGAEKTLQVLSDVYARAPIFSLLGRKEFCEKFFGEKFKKNQIKLSFLQRLPGFLRAWQKILLPFMPVAVENFNLRDFDVVISSSSAFAKGVVVKPKTLHICYMHAPMRYVWDWHHEYFEENMKGVLKLPARFLARFFLNYLRTWDRASADRVDFFVANSKYTAARIKKYYRKEAAVIYPPVDVDRFSPTKEHKGYFLSVCRLMPYKRVDLIVETFNKLKLPLYVVGAGPERRRLERLARGNEQIKILGFVSEEKLPEIFAGARAFVCATEDDFNITCVEAMAAGKPVIALGKGGTKETVIEGETGEFFDAPQLEILADGVRRFIENEDRYDFERIRKRAEEFGKERFIKEIKDFVEEKTEEGGLKDV